MQWKTKLEQKVGKKVGRRIGQITMLAIIIAIIFIAFAPRATLVNVSVVKTGPLQETVEEEGKTRVKDRFIISAPVAGFVRRIDLTIGDQVGAAQVVAELEPLRPQVLDLRSQAEARAQVEAAKSARLLSKENAKAAKADAEFAASERQRLNKLYQSKVVSLKALQQAQANARRTAAYLKSSEFAVQVAQFELEAAQTALRYSANPKPAHQNSADANAKEQTETVTLVAPVSGQILEIYHKSEGIVTEGEALLEIGDPGSLEIEVDVLSPDAVKISEGTPVNLTRWGGNTTLRGSVRLVEPVGFTKISALGVEEQRVLVIVNITSPPNQWQRLGDGYRVQASFVLWEGDNVLQIPASALFRYQREWTVFVYEDSQAKLRKVALGHRSGLVAEVTAGLSKNEQVITHPDDSLHNGKRVRLRQ